VSSGGNATAHQNSYSGFHWLCTQNPAQSPHKDTDALSRARRGALGERIRLWGQPSCGSRAARVAFCLRLHSGRAGDAALPALRGSR
jgi:hypothetical protein